MTSTDVANALATRRDWRRRRPNSGKSSPSSPRAQRWDVEQQARQDASLTLYERARWGFAGVPVLAGGVAWGAGAGYVATLLVVGGAGILAAAADMATRARIVWNNAERLDPTWSMRRRNQ